MTARVRRRLAALDGEAGMTLIELLVAMIMGMIVVGASTAMLISAVRDQPKQQKQAENVDTARYELERMTREIRDGVSVTSSAPNSVSFVARVRRTTCGGSVQASQSVASIQCQIVYSCTTTSCTRVEREVGKTSGGVASTIVTGIDSSEVFCFVPSANADPTECGPAQTSKSPTYVGITLKVPNPSGPGSLTVSDGASMRSATLSF
ncbi:MAG TPA: prepilin-type N-terminal cleavage/methylation domain-containing protein [Solirubrobacterales bacterium]|jgi:type II secretory pathway pseudopilin PulG